MTSAFTPNAVPFAPIADAVVDTARPFVAAPAVAVVSVPVSNRWVGTTPNASNTTTRIVSEANSPGSRSV